jgi:hypothetical protein
MKVHIWDTLRDVCIACGRTRQEIVENDVACDGTVKYREWLRGLVFSREPIIPSGAP